jgi:hypothetical protein
MVWTTLLSCRIQLGSLFRLDITIPTEEGPFFILLGVKDLQNICRLRSVQLKRLLSSIFTSGENSMFVTASFCMLIVL